MRTSSRSLVRFFLATSLALLAAPRIGAAPALAARAPLDPVIDAYLAKTLRDWDIPGAALAIVRDGRIAVARGYGVRELGKPERVDANTVFDVASLTKSFTAAAIATLVDEGKMAWDAPVRDYLPSIRFPDPYLTANVTLRDLLSHRVGVRSTNRAWYYTNVTRARLIELIPRMEIAAPFRTRLTYSNIGYAVAGEAAAAAAGMSWEELVTRRLLVPLGMTRTTATFDSSPAMGNIASGHQVIDSVHQVTPRETTRTSTAPAGAIQASVTDIARWMLFHLGDGTHAGRRILSPEAMNEMHVPQFAMPTTARFRASRQMRYFPSYGLGWQVFDYRGNPVLWHSGAGDGQLAYMVILPEQELGVAFMINTWKPGSPFTGAVVSRILDHELALPARDPAAEYRVTWEQDVQRAIEAERARAAARLAGTTPSLPAADHAGTYEDPLGLDIQVWTDQDTLRLRYGGGETATLTHWHRDTWRAHWQNPLHGIWPTFVTFALDPRGRIERLRMDPNGDEFEARRRAP